MADPFAAAGASAGGGIRPPSIAQLASGADSVTRTYAPGEDAEIRGVKTSGRLVAITPTKVERNLPAPTPGKTQDRMTCDVVVFDGEDIEAAVDKDGDEKYRPETPWVAPFKLKGMYISQVVLMGQLEDALRNSQTVIGRLGKLPRNSNGFRAWALLEAMPDEIEKAAPIFNKLSNPFADGE